MTISEDDFRKLDLDLLVTIQVFVREKGVSWRSRTSASGDWSHGLGNRRTCDRSHRYIQLRLRRSMTPPRTRRCESMSSRPKRRTVS
jgi:hypothetical protein